LDVLAANRTDTGPVPTWTITAFIRTGEPSPDLNIRGGQLYHYPMMIANPASRLGWRMPFCAVLAAIVLCVPLTVDINGMDALYLFVIAPSLFIIGVCALIYAAVRKKLQVALMVTTFWAAFTVLFIYSVPVHIVAKWLLWSHKYKNEVLAQPLSTNGDLKHLEWDGWGWGGQDISVFLVFDPMDSLREAAKNTRGGRFNGIPCEVSLVRRMEAHWYILFFNYYVDQSSWERCDS
jgi:hypothetical protein